ncbi:MAG: dTMP kinase, partial [Chloroflexota bacterium]|nr:dTMP kinase [Chloroflexota bacterium]
LEPDLTIYLDLDPVEGLRRRVRAGTEGTHEGWNRFDARELEFHQRVRAAYQRLADAWPRRVVTVDADRPYETVRADILEIVLSRLAVDKTGGTS